MCPTRTCGEDAVRCALFAHSRDTAWPCYLPRPIGAYVRDQDVFSMRLLVNRGRRALDVFTWLAAIAFAVSIALVGIDLSIWLGDHPASPLRAIVFWAFLGAMSQVGLFFSTWSQVSRARRTLIGLAMLPSALVFGGYAVDALFGALERGRTLREPEVICAAVTALYVVRYYLLLAPPRSVAPVDTSQGDHQ